MRPNAPILIVDDDASQRRLIEFWLQEKGYRTITAAADLWALERWAQHSPALVIAEMHMPGLTGFDVLTRVKSLNCDTPVILIGAFDAVLPSSLRAPADVAETEESIIHRQKIA